MLIIQSINLPHKSFVGVVPQTPVRHHRRYVGVAVVVGAVVIRIRVHENTQTHERILVPEYVA